MSSARSWAEPVLHEIRKVGLHPTNRHTRIIEVCVITAKCDGHGELGREQKGYA